MGEGGSEGGGEEDGEKSQGGAELHHLVALRDGMLQAKEKELALVSQQNEGLRAKLDAMEAGAAELQNALRERDMLITNQRKEVDRSARDVKRLLVELEEHRGRERGMEVAATHNTRLLKLLEQEEMKREDVLRERDEAQSEVAELRERVFQHNETLAKMEAGLRSKLVKALNESMACRAKTDKMEQETATLQSELRELKRESLFQVDAMKDELADRRSKQYALLEDVQAAQDSRQKYSDEAEAKGEANELLQLQNTEMKMALGKVQDMLRELESQHREQVLRGEEQAAELSRSLGKERESKRLLANRVDEMSQSLAHVLGKLQAAKQISESRKQEIEELNVKLQEAAYREEKQVSANIRLKSGMRMEVTQKKLKKAISQFTALQEARPTDQRPATSKAALHYLAWSKRQLLQRLMLIAAGASLEKLLLNDCGLTDADLAEVAAAVKKTPKLMYLDLSSNQVTDGGAGAVASLLACSTCRLRHVDLRFNGVTRAGLRELAAALEGHTSRNFESVYVNAEGRVDALTRLEEGGPLVSGVIVDATECQMITASPIRASPLKECNGLLPKGGLKGSGKQRKRLASPQKVIAPRGTSKVVPSAATAYLS